jgi:hypothetical protein
MLCVLKHQRMCTAHARAAASLADPQMTVDVVPPVCHRVQRPACRPLVAAAGGGAAAAEGLAPANGSLHLATSARSSPQEPRGAAGNAEFYSPTSSLNRWVQRTSGLEVKRFHRRTNGGQEFQALFCVCHLPLIAMS